jgi:hypothetical protein
MSLLKEWEFQLWDTQRKISIDDDAAQLLVLTADAPTAPTIYSDAVGTAVSNAVRTPRTFTNGRVRFWTAPSVTSVDLSLITSKGEAYFFEDVASSCHRLDVNPFQREHTLVVPFGVSDNTETDTGINLPTGLLVKDAFIKVVTTDASETLDVGILASESGGDADGFVLATSVATAGYVNPWPVVTGGTNIDYHVHTAGYGAFLKDGIAGADAVATVGGVQRRYYKTDGVATSISYTGSSGSDTAAGYIVLQLTRLP